MESWTEHDSLLLQIDRFSFWKILLQMTQTRQFAAGRARRLEKWPSCEDNARFALRPKWNPGRKTTVCCSKSTVFLFGILLQMTQTRRYAACRAGRISKNGPLLKITRSSCVQKGERTREKNKKRKEEEGGKKDRKLGGKKRRCKEKRRGLFFFQ